jgi:hypothetical protein
MHPAAAVAVAAGIHAAALAMLHVLLPLA